MINVKEQAKFREARDDETGIRYLFLDLGLRAEVKIWDDTVDKYTEAAIRVDLTRTLHCQLYGDLYEAVCMARAAVNRGYPERADCILRDLAARLGAAK